MTKPFERNPDMAARTVWFCHPNVLHSDDIRAPFGLDNRITNLSFLDFGRCRKLPGVGALAVSLSILLTVGCFMMISTHLRPGQFRALY